jgi:hypothetical protein
MTQVYTMPDPKVSKLWINTTGQVFEVRMDFKGELRLSKPGSTEDWITIGNERWLPVILPTFPARQKSPMRLCMATRMNNDSRVLLVWRNNPELYCPYSDVKQLAYKPEDIVDVVWLTPEYLDELVKEPLP